MTAVNYVNANECIGMTRLNDVNITGCTPKTILNNVNTNECITNVDNIITHVLFLRLCTTTWALCTFKWRRIRLINNYFGIHIYIYKVANHNAFYYFMAKLSIRINIIVDVIYPEHLISFLVFSGFRVARS